LNRPLLIFGIGQVADVFHYYVTEEGGKRVVAFTVDGKYLKEDSHLGVPVVDFETVEKHFPPTEFDMMIAVSFKEVNKARQRKVAEACSSRIRVIRTVRRRGVGHAVGRSMISDQ